MKLWTLLAAATSFVVQGIPPRPGWREVALGDCVIKLQPHGDAFFKYWSNEEGYTLCQTGSGDFVFIDQDGTCSEQELMCNRRKPEWEEATRGNLPKRRDQEEDTTSGEDLAGRYAGRFEGKSAKERGDEVQNVRNLVLMIRFSDHKEKELPSTSEYEVLFNSEQDDFDLARTGSLREYYKTQSYGKLVIDSVLTGWIDVPFTERDAAGEFPSGETPCHGTCQSSKLHDAIKAGLALFEERDPELFATFDQDGNSRVDMFTIIHSGYGAESGSTRPDASYWIWSHRSSIAGGWASPRNGLLFSSYNINAGLWGESGSRMMRLGLVAHEVAHFLGLPDFYDVDESSFGVGFYDVMANSWGADGSQLYPGSFSCPSKYLLGWVNPSIIKGGSDGEGEYTLRSFQEEGECFLLSLNHDPAAMTEAQLLTFQFILIENRRPVQWDRQLTGGILLWHVDNAKLLAAGRSGSLALNPDANRFELEPLKPSTWPLQHFGVRLIQADKQFHLERKVNQEDSADWWKQPSQVAGDDEVFPNLQTYDLAAEGVRSGHYLESFATSPTFAMDQSMVFRYRYELLQGKIALPVEPATDEPLQLSIWAWVGIGAGSMLVTIVVTMVILKKVLPPVNSQSVLSVPDSHVLSSSPQGLYQAKASSSFYANPAEDMNEDLEKDLEKELEKDMMENLDDDLEKGQASVSHGERNLTANDKENGKGKGKGSIFEKGRGKGKVSIVENDFKIIARQSRKR